MRFKEKMFHNETGEVLEQVAQRGSECPISANIQGQAGWGQVSIG